MVNKLDGVALLVAVPPCANSTDKPEEKKNIFNPPLYIVITLKQIMQFRNPFGFRIIITFWRDLVRTSYKEQYRGLGPSCEVCRAQYPDIIPLQARSYLFRLTNFGSPLVRGISASLIFFWKIMS